MLLFFLLSCRSIPKGDTSQPDIILVSIDTLRADHVSSYGYERKTTPFIDELASKGMRFSHAWSTSSWTLPAHTSLLSGSAGRTMGPTEVETEGQQEPCTSQTILWRIDDIVYFHINSQGP